MAAGGSTARVNPRRGIIFRTGASRVHRQRTTTTTTTTTFERLMGGICPADRYTDSHSVQPVAPPGEPRTRREATWRRCYPSCRYVAQFRFLLLSQFPRFFEIQIYIYIYISFSRIGETRFSLDSVRWTTGSGIRNSDWIFSRGAEPRIGPRARRPFAAASHETSIVSTVLLPPSTKRITDNGSSGAIRGRITGARSASSSIYDTMWKRYALSNSGRNVRIVNERP